MQIQRDLLQILRAHLSRKEITLLVGARQVGKTTLLRALREELAARGERTVWFNLDLEADFLNFSSQARLLAKLELETGGQPAFIFIDEIQRKENAGLFLKGLYDLDLPYKLIVSGSGSLELKEKIHESLAGRKRIFELWPVTFREFLDFRTGYRYSDRLAQWVEVEKEQRELLLLEYLNFGGYPLIVTEPEGSEKQLLLQELFQSYLEKDLIALMGLEKSHAFTLMIRLMADRLGQQLNYSGLAGETGLAVPTLKKYLWYAEKTFILQSLPPYFRNAAKELTKSPQVYFKDLGLRNMALRVTGKLNDLAHLGMLFQNFVFLLLSQPYEPENFQLKYWRTKDQAEVDFIVDKAPAILPVEVKCQRLNQPRITRSLRSFIETYAPPEVWIVNLSLSQVEGINGTKIRFLPWYELLTETQ